jgi:hypothetical protein
MSNPTHTTYWLKGKNTQGNGFDVCFTKFWKMLCYKEDNTPVTGEKITITYKEYNS